MPVMSGLEFATRLQALSHRARIVIATMHVDVDLVRAARAIGALGFVLKYRVHADLPSALRQALMGRPFVSPGLGLDQDGLPEDA